MDWREKALMWILLVLLILSLTFGPGWSMALPILFAVIFGVHKGKQEDQEAQGEQEKQNPLDSTPARDASAHASDHVIAVPADAPDHAPVDAPADASAHASDHVIAVPADAPDHAPVDAPADASAHGVNVPADGLALSSDSLAPAVDAPADAALSVDAPVVAAGIRMRRKGKVEAHVKLSLHDDKDRSKAMQAVRNFAGISSVDMEDNILLVSGEFDVVKLVSQLRKSCHVTLLSFE